VCHQRRLYSLHRHHKERGSAPGAVLGEAGRPPAMLPDDFLSGSTGGMMDGRKKCKGFSWFRLEWSI